MAYHNILVPVDGSETSHAAVEKAVEFAKAFGSKITVVQSLVLDPYIAAEYISASQTNDLIERARTSIEESLAAAKAKFNEQGIEVETKLLEGQVIHREIIRAAEELHADLIIIGSHGRTGFKKLFLGSVAQSLLGESHIPVLIVRQP
ncbi:universal stress protein [Acinetobacter sp.]|uniref:universal stress protein n=1 Tax=Acinetobacter sp. TaxID=472 RepID=UPI002FC6FCE2